MAGLFGGGRMGAEHIGSATVNGVLGLHIIGDTGNSNENAVAFARQLGGRYCTIVNSDWKLYAPLLDSGIQVIGRWKNDDWNDDDADNHQPGKEWARFLHSVYPDQRIYLTAGNELGTGTPTRTRDWMIAFVEEAARLGHPTAAYHSHFLSPPKGGAYWASQKPALDAIRANKGIVCVHKGFAAKWKDVPELRGQTAIDEDFSRILEIQAYNLPVVITEFTGSLQPDRGWEFLYKNDAQAAIAEADLGLKWCAEHGIYATYFTWWKWHNGEGFELTGEAKHRQEFRAGLININRKYPVKEGTMATQRIKVTGFPPNVPYRNIRTVAGQGDADSDIGDLRVGDVVDVDFTFSLNGWFEITRPADNVTGWVLFTGIQYEDFVPNESTNVTYSKAEHDKLTAAFNAVQVELDGAKKLLKGQVSPPSEPFF